MTIVIINQKIGFSPGYGRTGRYASRFVGLTDEYGEYLVFYGLYSIGGRNVWSGGE